MGEFFKDSNVIEQKEEELILNFNELCATYNILLSKIDETTSQGYEAILPIRTELTGGGKSPDDIGQIGMIRRRIERTRIFRMDLGIMMHSALRNIEDLDKWSERYSEYLEKHIDGLKVVCRSGFKIIEQLQKEIGALNEKNKELHAKIIMQSDLYTGAQFPTEDSRARQRDIEKKIEIKFQDELNKRISKYKEALELGDKKLISLEKHAVILTAMKEPRREKIAEEALEKADREMQPEEPKPINEEGSVFSSFSKKKFKKESV